MRVPMRSATSGSGDRTSSLDRNLLSYKDAKNSRAANMCSGPNDCL